MTHAFRSKLLVRIVSIGAAAGLTHAACGDGGSGGAGGSGAGSAEGGAGGDTLTSTSMGMPPYDSQQNPCYDHAALGLTSAVGAGGAGGAPGVVCPSSAEEGDLLWTAIHDEFSGNCGIKLEGMELTQTETQCCYAITVTMCVTTGRPMTVDGAPRSAPVRRGAQSTGWSAGVSPELASLDAATRAHLAALWARDAAGEHASIASFSRFAIELMRFGAPAELVEGAHRAALDEVAHARIAYAFASAYAGTTLSPGAIALPASLPLASELAEMAAGVAEEGCVAETIAAAIVSERAQLAGDAAVREALATIANDEAGHAELAWRTLRWALDAGGEVVRLAVSAAFERAIAAQLASAGCSVQERAEAVEHGAIGASDEKAVARAVVHEVIVPAMRAMGLGDPRVEA